MYENDLSAELLTLGATKFKREHRCYWSVVSGPWKCPLLSREEHISMDHGAHARIVHVTLNLG